MATFLSMLRRQDDLQRTVFGFDFDTMDDAARMRYIRDNALALTAELHEALDETGWKPWASSNHLDEKPYVGELVDVFHFLMNLLLVTGRTPSDLAEEFCDRYFAKSQLNAERQEAGYDGVAAKCPNCKRALDETVLNEILDVDTRRYETRCPCGELLKTSDSPA